MEISTAIHYLNHPIDEIRFECVKVLSAALHSGKLPRIERINGYDNYLHSYYSFSPDSPSMIAWKAYQLGVSTCGLVDHESVAGCLEFREACRLFGIAPAIGFEIRMNCNNTPLREFVFNEFDQKSIGYFPVYGVPVSKLSEIEKSLRVIRHERYKRNLKMIHNINAAFGNYALYLDYELDIVPVSKWIMRGSVTEKHLLYAMAKKILEKYKMGEAVSCFLKKNLEIKFSKDVKNHLMETENPYYLLFVMNVLSVFFRDQIYEPAGIQEAPSVESTIPFFTKLGCIPAYAYSGGRNKENVTGENADWNYEINILDEMINLLKNYGMRAISYTLYGINTQQIQMVRNLCNKYEMLEIVGGNIEQPGLFFDNIKLPRFTKLYFEKTSWAIIGHEIAVDKNLSQGIFSKEMCMKYPRLKERIHYFEKIGRNFMK